MTATLELRAVRKVYEVADDARSSPSTTPT